MKTDTPKLQAELTIEENKVPNIKIEVKVGYHKKSAPYPTIDFSLAEKYKVQQGSGGALIAANNRELKEMLDSRWRLDPNAEEARYFYYEVKQGE
jgi:hypothetical protein